MFDSYRRYYYNLRVLQKRTVNASDVKQAPFTGVAQRLARRAHNPEVVCSIHTAGIITLSFVLQKRVVKLDPKRSIRLVRDVKRNTSDVT